MSQRTRDLSQRAREVVVQAIEGGDLRAAMWWLDREDRLAVPLDVDTDPSFMTPAQQGATILDAAIDGRISTTQADKLLRVVERVANLAVADEVAALRTELAEMQGLLSKPLSASSQRLTPAWGRLVEQNR